MLLLISSMQHMKLAMPFKICAKQWSVNLINFYELLNVETYVPIFITFLL